MRALSTDRSPACRWPLQKTNKALPEMDGVFRDLFRQILETAVAG